MSGSNLSAPASPGEPDPAPLNFSVHSMPVPALADEEASRRNRGRLKMLLVLFVCALPVIASYLSYFVIRPESRTNYSTLVDPPRPVPGELTLVDLQGAPADRALLRGNWTLVVVGGGACDERCEKQLWLVRQLREALGRDRDRVDKLWLIDDDATPKPELATSLASGAPTRIWRAPRDALAGWLQAEPGQPLSAHLYIVDPHGHWMMRAPAQTDPGRFKRDVERLLRASASWQTPARR